MDYQLLENAGLSNYEIASVRASRDLVDDLNTREIGKNRQHSTEYLIQEWINKSKEIPFSVKRQSELNPDEQSDHNESGWDLLDPVSGFRIQVKYRGGAGIHLEQTRRSSTKNKGAASKTGHVVYSVDEFDVLIVVRPLQIRNDFKAQEDVLIISEFDLRDQLNPGFLKRAVGRCHERELRATNINKTPSKYLVELYNSFKGHND